MPPSSQQPPPPAMAGDQPWRPDENVQFTVYRPAVVWPGPWHLMLAFAHLSEKRPTDPDDDPDPLEEVCRLAEQALGARLSEYRPLTQDSRYAVPREGELVFLPEAPGVEFNPSSRSFRWLEPVHKEEFRFRVPASLAGQTVRGRLTVCLGSLLLADVRFTLKIGAQNAAPAPPVASNDVTRYRKVFASYSHKDLHVVEEFERHAKALGDCYLRDWVDLRAGEHWAPRLLKMIEEADVFQLFWSRNAMHSEPVRHEYEHALQHARRKGRDEFVRPVFWEEPMPTEPGLPPEQLAQLHFQRIYPTASTIQGSPAISLETQRAPAPERPPAATPPSWREAPHQPSAQEPNSAPARRRESVSCMAAGLLAAVLFAAVVLMLKIPSGGKVQVAIDQPGAEVPVDDQKREGHKRLSAILAGNVVGNRSDSVITSIVVAGCAVALPAAGRNGGDLEKRKAKGEGSEGD